MISEKEDFDYTRASKIDVSDGCVKCVWLEESKTTKLDEDNNVMLTDGYNALIEFENGRKMIITNSEWVSLNWL